jgi:hypothetical protein
VCLEVPRGNPGGGRVEYLVLDGHEIRVSVSTISGN